MTKIVTKWGELARIDPTVPAHVLEAKVEDLLKREFGQRLVFKTNPSYDPAHGYDEAFSGFDWRGDLDQDRALSIEACAKHIAGLVAPAGHNDMPRIIAELTRLRARTGGMRSNETDMELTYTELSQALAADYPAWAIIEACKIWSRTEKWFPTESELREKCDFVSRHLRRYRDNLEQLARRRQGGSQAQAEPTPPPKYSPPTSEQREAVAAVMEKARQDMIDREAAIKASLEESERNLEQIKRQIAEQLGVDDGATETA